MKGKNSSKGISFILVLALLMSMIMPGMAMAENAYAAGETQKTPVSAYVSILTGDENQLAVQPLNIDWFDLKPFMTSGAAVYTNPDDIVTAHALIEGVYYNLYGKDASAADLTVDAESDIAKNIRAKADISLGNWGLSQNSVYGDYNLQSSYINNESAASGIGSQKINAGDRIDFCKWTEPYVYIDLLGISADVADWGKYPAINATLKVSSQYYDNTFALHNEPLEGAGIIVNGESYVYKTTGASGVVTTRFERMGSEKLVIAVTGAGISQNFLLVDFTWDGTNTVINSTSHTPLADTSLKTLEITAYDNPINMFSYADGNLPLVVKPDTETVVLKAETNSSEAVVSCAGISFPNATGGAVTISLTDDSTSLDIVVSNNSSIRTYRLVIVKGASADNNVRIDSAINSITSNTSYQSSMYDAAWIIGKTSAGKAISQAEKDAFLANVLLYSKTASLGGKAKMIMALTALNIDARKVPVKGSSEVYDLVDAVYNGGSIGWITEAPYLLMMMDSGVYPVPENAIWGREEVIQYILDNRAGWQAATALYGLDSSAMVVAALAPYYLNDNGYNGISDATSTEIKSLVAAELAAYKTNQETNGTIGNNANTTAMVIAAMAACGLDADTDNYRNSATGNTIVDGLFLYQSQDGRFGYQDREYNSYATSDALIGLAAYKEFKAGLDGNPYLFTKEVLPYTKWPDAKLLTSIKIENLPTNRVYNYSETETSASVDTTGMVVKAVFNGNAGDTEIITEGYAVSTIDKSQPGAQTVTVTYQGQTATFIITVKDSTGNVAKENTAGIIVRSSGKGIIASNRNIVIQEGRTSALDVLKQVLDSNNVSYIIKGGNYVASIAGLGEFDEGPNSGWLYSVNGVTPPTTAANEYKLSDGDAVVWYYTADYTKDSSSSSWNKEEQKTETNGEQVAAKVEVEVKTDSNGKAEAKVDSKTVDTAIADVVKAAEGKADAEKQVTLDVKADKDAKEVSVELPKDAVKSLDSKVDSIAITTPVGEIKLDSKALTSLANQGSDVKVDIAKSETADGRPAYTVNITSGNDNINLQGKVTLAFEYKKESTEEDNKLVLCRIDENGNKIPVVKSKYEDGVMTGKTANLGDFVLEYRDITFEDTNSHWGKDNIEYLAARSVIKGKAQDTFAPEDKITRAEFVQLLYGMSEDSNGNSDENNNIKNKPNFYDIAAKAWYAEAVAWAAENGITTGTGNNNFSPDVNISRQDMSVMIKKYVELIEKETLADKKEVIEFSDGDNISPYAKKAVTDMQKAGIINGTKNQDGSYSFNPAANATRAEAATMLANYLNN